MKDSLVDNFCLFGLETLHERLPAITAELEGVRRAEDIECVHRMRVASRRARNVLALFGECLPPKHYDDWRKELRRVTRALGVARDLDVQIAWVEDFQVRCSEAVWRPGVARLLLRLRQQRAHQQEQVVKIINRLEEKRSIEDMTSILHDMIVHERVYEIEELPADLADRTYESILLRLEEFLAFEPFVAYPERVNELHQMRIAAKHLRYTLEVFAPLYNGELKSSIKVVKEIQTMLGDLHDCDVWLTFLPQFLQQERSRTLDYFGVEQPLEDLIPGIEALEADRARQREERYQVFASFWKLTRKYNIWNNLRTIIRPVAEEFTVVSEEISTGDEEGDIVVEELATAEENITNEPQP
jgi:CHAD domain-containing protein